MAPCISTTSAHTRSEPSTAIPPWSPRGLLVSWLPPILPSLGSFLFLQRYMYLGPLAGDSGLCHLKGPLCIIGCS